MFESRTQVGRLCFSYIIITKSCLCFSNILDAFFSEFEAKHNAGELFLCYKIVVNLGKM
jgi:hypothetical protein